MYCATLLLSSSLLFPLSIIRENTIRVELESSIQLYDVVYLTAAAVSSYYIVYFEDLMNHMITKT